ncbi:hypothetical protein T492DRAFT_872684 [Pavlovales sp. CCMP2436]|nr:hypothetical protein T492DRAFT_872684 [Pavlovales sp. CCMP2436]
MARRGDYSALFALAHGVTDDDDFVLYDISKAMRNAQSEVEAYELIVLSMDTSQVAISLGGAGSYIKSAAGNAVAIATSIHNDHLDFSDVARVVALSAATLVLAAAMLAALDRVFGLALPGPHLDGTNASIGPIEAELNTV